MMLAPDTIKHILNTKQEMKNAFIINSRYLQLINCNKDMELNSANLLKKYWSLRLSFDECLFLF